MNIIWYLMNVLSVVTESQNLVFLLEPKVWSQFTTLGFGAYFAHIVQY